MEMFHDVAVVIQSMSIGLGVGSSTLAIVSYFVAISDGNMEPVERKMMQPIYVVLRISMLLILITVLFEGFVLFNYLGLGAFSGFFYGMWTAVAVLFINAVLMTKHIMPMVLGPAIQASAWYAVGFLNALFMIGVRDFSYGTFIIYYGLLTTASIILVNAVTFYLKRRYTPLVSE